MHMDVLIVSAMRFSKKSKFPYPWIVLQGVPTQKVIFHFALAGRNMQASFGLKMILEA